VVAVLASLLSAAPPALQLLRPTDLGHSLKEAARGSSCGRSAARLRDVMSAGEVALAVVLLAGSALLIRTFALLQEQDKGFRAERIDTFRVALGWKRYIDQELIARYYERSLQSLAAVPGVEGVAFGPSPPLARQEQTAPATVQLEGQSRTEAMNNPYVNAHQISERYFELLGIPVRAGRPFDDFDGPAADPVAIVSERMARALWPGADPIGKRLLYDPTLTASTNRFRTVVGVVGDVQHQKLGGDSSFDLYVPYRQWAASNQYLLVRHRMTHSDFVRQAESALWTIDSEQSLFDFKPYAQRILDGVWQLRVSRTLLTMFGLVALTLAAGGIYGVTAFLVGQRQREIGIRIALGASPSRVRSMVLWRGMLSTGAGLAVGLLGAIALARVLERLLGVRAADPVAFSGTLAILVLTAALASGIPALRASRVDAARTLRQG
jgi:predicted permease